jgi:opacity protein-like surface antigen
MRRVLGFSLAVALVASQASAQAAVNQETSNKVAGGGISLAGWMGRVDAGEAAKGLKVEDAKLVGMGPGFHVTTGPAINYWNPANKVSGDYKVTATFNEANYMGLNDHPHPYGIIIAAKAFDTDKPEGLYCAAYGDGHFIFRGFSSSAPRGTFQMDGRAGTVNAAVNKAAGKGSAVKQEISMWVKGDKVGCTINGTEVASYDKGTLIGDGKLTSLDGVAGVRFGHNTDAHVAGFAIGKP